MPITYYRSPVGIIRITEEGDFITSVHFMDEEVEIIPPETNLLKLAVLQMDEYFAGERKDFDLPIR